MNAKKYLSQIKLLDGRINRKIEEKEYLVSLASGTGSKPLTPDKVQTSTNLHKTEDLVVRCVDLEAEIDRMIDSFVLMRDQIINEINQLGDPRYEELLYLKYVGRQEEGSRIHYCRLEEIACIMEKSNGDWYSYEHICRLHGEALKKFAERHGNAM